MTPPVASRAARSLLAIRLPLAAALLATLAAPAFAQGTPEQREACAPDAVRLCPDTIPDIGRTKACMLAHAAELSPRCHTVFLGATTPAAIPRRKLARITPAPEPMTRRRARIAMAAPDAPRAAPAPAPIETPTIVTPAIAIPTISARDFDFSGFDDAPTGSTRADARQARKVVARLCRDSLLDPGTCAFTNRLIDLAR